MGKGTIGESQTWAFLAVLLGIIGFILVLLTKKDDKYAMYYAKQSLVLMLVWFVGAVASGLLTFVVIGAILFPILMLLVLVLWIITMINALSGKEKPTPIIGQFAEKFNF